MRRVSFSSVQFSRRQPVLIERAILQGDVFLFQFIFGYIEEEELFCLFFLVWFDFYFFYLFFDILLFGGFSGLKMSCNIGFKALSYTNKK